jgi:hypothetical protein
VIGNGCAVAPVVWVPPAQRTAQTLEIMGAAGNFTYRTPNADGERPLRRRRRPWSAVAVNKVIASMDQVLADAKQQGLAGPNIAELVNRVAVPHKDIDT